MSKWSRAYKNSLPDSSFLYVEPGGHKDSTGRTVPRTNRHLPVYDRSGKLSLSHVRSVLGSYGQRAQIPAQAKAEAMAIARGLLQEAHEGPASHRRLRLPPITPGAHTCAHCRQKVKGHPVTFWSEHHAPMHYHPHHAKHHQVRRAPRSA